MKGLLKGLIESLQLANCHGLKQELDLVILEDCERHDVERNSQMTTLFVSSLGSSIWTNK